jgi:hypothetical protein
MKKEKFNELAMRSGFVLVRCLDKKYRLSGEDSHDVIEEELYAFKNLLLDEVVKELEAAKSSENISGMEVHFAHNRALQHAIEKIEAMK